MLEGELDSHLGYDKHQKPDNPNARIGFTEKKVCTSLGESKIQVPRDRDSSFNPIIVPQRGNMVDGIENVIASLYAKGMKINWLWHYQKLIFLSILRRSQKSLI